MSVPGRIAGFVAGLGVLFGAGALIGAATGADAPGGEDGAPHVAADAHGGHMGHEPAGPAEGLSLALDTADRTAGRAAPLRFRVLDGDGRPVRRYGVSHTKRMHLIVVRDDLTGFVHLHPHMAADGTWTTTLPARAAGRHRVFADFAEPDGTRRTVDADLRVAGRGTFRPLPAPRATARTGGYAVRLSGTPVPAGREATLRFTVTRAGRPATLQPYLGALGHLVALRDGDLAFLHVHPEDGALAFATTLPTAGRYRLFLQFRHAGRVRTAAFTTEAR